MERKEKVDFSKCPLFFLFMKFMKLFPQEVSEHLIKAKKEILLAVRALLDAQIEKLEKCEKKEEEKEQKAEKINIE